MKLPMNLPDDTRAFMAEALTLLVREQAAIAMLEPQAIPSYIETLPAFRFLLRVLDIELLTEPDAEKDEE